MHRNGGASGAASEWVGENGIVDVLTTRKSKTKKQL
jgi:hypothetical protein